MFNEASGLCGFLINVASGDRGSYSGNRVNWIYFDSTGYEVDVAYWLN